MTTAYIGAWFSAFLFTQIVEMPIYRRYLNASWLEAFGASALSHPIVWFVIFRSAFHASYLERAIYSELLAWLSEAAYFRFLLRRDRALTGSLLANTASVVLTLLSRALFGGP